MDVQYSCTVCIQCCYIARLNIGTKIYIYIHLEVSKTFPIPTYRQIWFGVLLKKPRHIIVCKELRNNLLTIDETLAWKDTTKKALRTKKKLNQFFNTVATKFSESKSVGRHTAVYANLYEYHKTLFSSRPSCKR